MWVHEEDGNGSVVDVNVDIFEAGFEGLALQTYTASNISDTIIASQRPLGLYRELS